MKRLIIGEAIYTFDNNGKVTKKDQNGETIVLDKNIVELLDSVGRFEIACNSNKRYNIWDNERFCFVFPSWYQNIAVFENDSENLRESFRVIVTRDDGNKNVYDLQQGKFILHKWYYNVAYFNSEYIIIKKAYCKCSLIKIESGRRINDMWYHHISNFDDHYVVVENDRYCYNLVELETGHLVTKTWLCYPLMPCENKRFALLCNSDKKCVGVFSFESKKSLFDFICDSFVHLEQDYYLIKEMYGKGEWLYDFARCEFIYHTSVRMLKHIGVYQSCVVIETEKGYNIIDLSTGKFILSEFFACIDIVDWLNREMIYRCIRRNGSQNFFAFGRGTMIFDAWYKKITKFDTTHVLGTHLRTNKLCILSIETGKVCKIVD